MSDDNVRLFKFLRLYCQASAVAVVGIGCMVLIGWAFHVEFLKSILPGLVTMKANTALSLALSAASLLIQLSNPPPGSQRYLGRVIALLVTLLAIRDGDRIRLWLGSRNRPDIVS